MKSIKSERFDRRAFLSFMGKAVAVTSGVAILGGGSLRAATAAHDAAHQTPVFPAPELPRLEIGVANDYSITVASEIRSGTVALSISFAVEDWADLMLVQVPEDATEEDVVAALESEEMPELIFQSRVVGSVYFEPGGAPIQEMVIELAPGEWYVGVVGEATSSYTTFTATGEPVVTPIKASVEVAYDHWDFAMPHEIPSGPQVWRITNNDPALHHMVIYSYPEPLDDEQVLGLMLASEGMASPVPGLDPDQLEYAGGFGILSQGEVMYQSLDLAPGYYSANCYLSEPGDDTPHVMLGMIESFTVV